MDNIELLDLNQDSPPKKGDSPEKHSELPGDVRPGTPSQHALESALLAEGASAGEAPPCSCRHVRGADGRVVCERFERWQRHCGATQEQHRGQYAQLLCSARQTEALPCLGEQTMRQVMLDVERTCPALSFFKEGGGREMLINILVAWIVWDAANPAPRPKTDEEGEEKQSGEEVAVSEEGTSVGYVQGMSFLAMNLLWHAGREEPAFWVFVAMMKTYDLRCMFQAPDMHGLRKRTFATTQLLHYAMPALSDHLAEYLQNSLGLLLTDWLLTLFASSVALAPLAELWDRFFELGFVWIYRVILARLRCLQKWLMEETDFAKLMHIVRFAHVDFDWVNGQVAPRLRGPHTPTAAGERESGSKPGLLQRFVRGRRRKTGEQPPPECPETSGQPAAWTCQVCNGSEDCWSWRTIVTELAETERLPASVAEHFEAMFSAAGPVALLGGAPAPKPEPPALEAPGEEDPARLRAENAQLRSENEKLRAELQLATRELGELKRLLLQRAERR